MLAGQYSEYLVLQLELFAKEHRSGTRWSRLMHEVAPKLEPQEMRDVAAYYESLAPTRRVNPRAARWFAG